MGKHLRFLGRTTLATFIGLVTLVALLIASFILLLILESVFFTPPKPRPEGLGVISLGPGFTTLLISGSVLYLLSVSIASFIAGFHLRRNNWEAFYQILYTLISGFVIGSVIPFYLSFVPFRSFSLINLIYSFPGILGALAGYYIASRRYK